MTDLASFLSEYERTTAGPSRVTETPVQRQDRTSRNLAAGRCAECNEDGTKGGPLNKMTAADMTQLVGDRLQAMVAEEQKRVNLKLQREARWKKIRQATKMAWLLRKKIREDYKKNREVIKKREYKKQMEGVEKHLRELVKRKRVTMERDARKEIRENVQGKDEIDDIIAQIKEDEEAFREEKEKHDKAKKRGHRRLTLGDEDFSRKKSQLFFARGLKSLMDQSKMKDPKAHDQITENSVFGFAEREDDEDTKRIKEAMEAQDKLRKKGLLRFRRKEDARKEEGKRGFAWAGSKLEDAENEKKEEALEQMAAEQGGFEKKKTEGKAWKSQGVHWA